ncbi:MAG: hypothetical protein DMG13_03530, partial [Acidobacteria bacterium]
VLGVVRVGAAGNNNRNAAVCPMYRAAYDNRGIVSVGASDQNDLGAGFTNYGLFNVDIMAPGVSTLSTVPTTGCSLCDPSGYKLLSGTSMATPHVAYAVATPASDGGPPPTPQFTITSPADGSIIARRSATTIHASVTPSTYSVGRVDLLVGSSGVCSHTSAPYSCNWNVPAAANKTYQLSANAYDANGQLVLVSNKVTVTAK